MAQAFQDNISITIDTVYLVEFLMISFQSFQDASNLTFEVKSILFIDFSLFFGLRKSINEIVTEKLKKMDNSHRSLTQCYMKFLSTLGQKLHVCEVKTCNKQGYYIK